MLDSGFLIAVDRDDRRASHFLRQAHDRSVKLHTTAPVLAQVWRSGGSRQARVARVIKSLDVHEFDHRDDWRRVGRLLATSLTDDIVDAHVMVKAQSLGLDVVTGDPKDFATLAGAMAGSPPTVKVWPPNT